MSWTVPTGCFYIAVRAIKPYTDPRTYNVYTYTSGETVTNQEHIPSTNQSDSPPIFLLADFDNGYIYTRTYHRTNNKEYPLFVIDASNQTVSFDARSMNGSYGVAGSVINICASQDTLPIGSTFSVPTIDVGDFVFGNGTGILDISAFPNGVGYSAEGAFRNRADITSATLPNGVTYASNAFYHCYSLTSATLPNSITQMARCFSGCTSLAIAPTLPTGVAVLSQCFDSCTSLTTPPVIPNGATSLSWCFSECTSLTSAPTIPSSINQMIGVFYNCNSLSGNIIVNNAPTSTNGIFTGTINDLYVIADTPSVETVWKDIVTRYSNVHYEADDNPIPAVSMTVTRVDSSSSETPSPGGLYAFINATAVIFNTYLPDNWTNPFTYQDISATEDSVSISPQWIIVPDGNTYSIKGWVPLSDTTKHIYTIQLSDEIEDGNGNVKATHLSSLITQILSKAYKLVDYYHDPVEDTEGVSFGKFATDANLFDVDMPALFRDDFIVHKLIGEIKMYAGPTIPTGWLLCDGSAVSRTDYPRLFSAIGITYGSGDGSTTFNLPNLKGRFPLGTGSIDAGDSSSEAYWGGTTSGSVNCSLGERAGEAWDTLGISQMPAHNHLVSSGWQSASGQPDRITYGAVNGGYNNTASGGIQFIQNTGGGGAHNNMPPFTTINFIICAI